MDVLGNNGIGCIAFSPLAQGSLTDKYLNGLASFSVAQRTKEIGIRKTLGASVPGILRLLSREFLNWIAIASIIPGGIFAVRVNVALKLSGR